MCENITELKVYTIIVLKMVLLLFIFIQRENIQFSYTYTSLAETIIKTNIEKMTIMRKTINLLKF